MERFGKLGIEIYVTEFDVNMHDVEADDQSKDQIEANIYYEMARACIESKVCNSFSILGITDKESWYNYLGLDESRPLLFDKTYKPKPAFYSLRSALEEM
jgi:endo-1,4-beta-xylanase